MQKTFNAKTPRCEGTSSVLSLESWVLSLKTQDSGLWTLDYKTASVLASLKCYLPTSSRPAKISARGFFFLSPPSDGGSLFGCAFAPLQRRESCNSSKIFRRTPHPARGHPLPIRPACQSAGRWGENSPKQASRFEPLQPQDTQTVDNQRDDLEVHGEGIHYVAISEADTHQSL